MKNAFLKVISWLTSLWRTLVSTFVRKHIYKKDVDQDGMDEIVIDPNGTDNQISQSKSERR